MIELSKEEAIDLLRKVSRIEGFLESVRGGDAIKHDVEGVADFMLVKLSSMTKEKQSLDDEYRGG